MIPTGLNGSKHALKTHILFVLVVLPVSLIVTTLDIRGVFNYCRAGDISKFPFHVVKRTKRTNKLYPERLGRIRGLKSGNLRVLCALF